MQDFPVPKPWIKRLQEPVAALANFTRLCDSQLSSRPHLMRTRLQTSEMLHMQCTLCKTSMLHMQCTLCNPQYCTYNAHVCNPLKCCTCSLGSGSGSGTPHSAHEVDCLKSPFEALDCARFQLFHVKAILISGVG